jgi:hypothetical protein
MQRKSFLQYSWRSVVPAAITGSIACCELYAAIGAVIERGSFRFAGVHLNITGPKAELGPLWFGELAIGTLMIWVCWMCLTEGWGSQSAGVETV